VFKNAALLQGIPNVLFVLVKGTRGQVSRLMGLVLWLSQLSIRESITLFRRCKDRYQKSLSWTREIVPLLTGKLIITVWKLLVSL